jgi:hypothetical protein
MSETRPVFDEEQLPWLQEVEDEDGPRGISARKMFAALLVVLAAAAIVAATFFVIGRRDASGNGAPELIRAPATPYKVKPENPGGLDVTGESQTTFETSAGEEVNGRLDTGKLGAPPITAQPEQPVTNTTATAAPPPPAAKPAPKPAPAPPPAASEPSAAGGSVVQLGAYKNNAQAERAWLALSSRFPQLGNATKMVVPYTANGSSGYRLRAAASSPANAKALCDALQAGGESCFLAK